MTVKLFTSLLLLFSMALWLPSARAQADASQEATPANEPTAAAHGDTGPAVEIEGVVVVGSRRQNRSVADSPVPVDLIDSRDLATQGHTDIDSLLSVTIPSYNVNLQPISDAATLVRPANLRGLSPDSTLVLVNGKRRHRSSVITFLGGGIADGSQAPDLAAIPYIALNRVEVLRDGASAQYGSDAVAGVMNFVLKDADRGGTVETRFGQHYEGDGRTYTIAANTGMPLMKGGVQHGFANFSFEYTEADPTSRSVQRDDAQAIIDANQPHISPFVRTPATQIWGSPEIVYDYKFFGNLGIDLGDRAQLYLFPSFARREVEGGFFFRNPTSTPSGRSGVFRDGDLNHLVADLRQNPDPGTVPTVALDGGVPSAADLEAVAADPNFYTFNERFPGGFTPQFGGVITDRSIGGGLRGELGSQWSYDLSAVFGKHETEFFLKNTINPQLLAHPDFSGNPNGIPTSYQPGTYIETDYAVNFDLSRPFETGLFHSPLNVATGLEYRVEEFEVKAGDEYSWWADARPNGLAAQGFGVASNGFPGFRPENEILADRGSYAAYLDLEADVVEDLLIGSALRYENYEGSIGDTLDGKLSSRWQMMDNVALRGSVSTGFRAPTIGQASIRNVSTTSAPLPGGGVRLVDRATLPPSDPNAIKLGAEPLKPETSVNFSLGAAANFGKLDLTLDYYHIKVKDRIALSPTVLWPEGEPNPLNLAEANWFSNDFDTITQGIDLVANYPIDHAGGATTLLTLVGNVSSTEVDSFRGQNDLVTEAAVAGRIDRLENNLPEVRFTLSAIHVMGPWRILLPRLRYYDDFIEYHAQADSLRISSGARWLVDAEVEYTFEGGVKLAVGAQNLFDTFPEENRFQGATGALYPNSSPYGFNGGFYYLRAGYAF